VAGSPAGQEVSCALHLLSDPAFKLFMWLCLHAERSRGCLGASPGELAVALGRKEDDVQLTLKELEQQQVCILGPGSLIEISDRFWPYQRSTGSMTNKESRAYVEKVKSLFFQRRCVQSSFTPADENLALRLYRSGIPLIQVERAIMLGACAQILCAPAQWGRQPHLQLILLYTDVAGSRQPNIEPILALCLEEDSSFRASLDWFRTKNFGNETMMNQMTVVIRKAGS
jgi:hypothetical protein